MAKGITIKKVSEGSLRRLKKYQVPEVAQAIGRSENSIYAYFSNRKVSTKNGITLEQIAEVAMSKRRGESINWSNVEEIREGLLSEFGLQVIEENLTYQQEEF